MTASHQLHLRGCSGKKAIPDLEMFPALSVLELHGCNGLTTLSRNVPLIAIQRLVVRGCRSLSPDTVDVHRPSNPEAEIGMKRVMKRTMPVCKVSTTSMSSLITYSVLNWLLQASW